MTQSNVDIQKLLKNIDRVKAQLPYAMSKTLNQLAFEASAAEKKALPHELKLTRSFLPRQIKYEKSSKTNLVARIGFTERAPLIDRMLESTSNRLRLPYRGTHIAVPINAKRTGRGGISRANRPEALTNRRDVFVGTVNGTYGIWQRLSARQRKAKGRTLSLLYALVDRTQYNSVGPVKLKRNVETVVSRRAGKYLAKNLEGAIKNAKR